jgi:hypothetical protein
MAYLNCGRCGLEIKIQAAFLSMPNCPRCLARSVVVTPLVLSAGGVTTAAGWRARPASQPSDPREPFTDGADGKA